MVKRKTLVGLNELGLIDAQYSLLVFHEMVGMMANDRPSDNDTTFVWDTFNSCIRILNAVGAINGKMIKLILKMRKPTDSDNDNLDKYLREAYDLSEKMLNAVGWPKDVDGNIT
jgi:hypothetical protein